jgi:hypothetical protein
MKFTTKAIPTLIVSLALAAAGTALAQSQDPAPYAEGDLLIGFTVGTGNDLIVNLGPAGTALVNNKSWNLSDLLATNFNAGSLSDINFGIIGETSPTSGAAVNTVYSTKVGTVNTFASQSAFNGIFTAIQGVGTLLNGSTGFGTPTATASGLTSWYGQTIGGGTSTFKTQYQNPNIQGTTPPSAVNFYTVTQGTSHTNIVQTGIFNLSPSGTLSFTTNISVVVTPPAPQIVNITRSGTTSTVFFTTTNGSFTYTLHYTNSIGLNAPISAWPTNATTVTGTGGTNSIPDTSTDAVRFYRVGVH